MTEPQIVYSDEALADLAALANYIADQDGKKRAEMIVGRILETIRTLAFMPGMGQARSYLREGRRAFYRFTVDYHLRATPRTRWNPGYSPAWWAA